MNNAGKMLSIYLILHQHQRQGSAPDVEDKIHLHRLQKLGIQHMHLGLVRIYD